jgi:hypothetical protein
MSLSKTSPLLAKAFQLPSGQPGRGHRALEWEPTLVEAALTPWTSSI